MNKEICITVLIYPDTDDNKGDWFAHCLDFDLLAHAKRPRDAIRRLIGVIISHIDYLEKEGLMDQLLKYPAPPEYWEKLHDAKPMGMIRLKKKAPEKVKVSDHVPPIHEMARINVEYGLA